MQEQSKNINDICFGCMKHIRINTICPHCGFSREKYEAERDSRVLPSGTVLNGKYLLGKCIGAGGFGITYLAMDLNSQSIVAIKEYFPTGLATRNILSSETERISVFPGREEEEYRQGLERFVTEARNLAKFQKIPGIATVKEFFFGNGTAYLVMDYIKGVSLKKYMKSRATPLSEGEVLMLMHPVLTTLSQIHDKGIIHRDISPDNIMLSEDGKIYLIDFGAARVATVNGEQSLTIFLKHGYAPVEQYQRRGRQGPWTDIYAVCATMYWMLSGIVPCEAINRLERDQVIPLKKLARESREIYVSDQVSDVIEKGLALRAVDRYQSLTTLAADLYEKTHVLKQDLEEGKTLKVSEKKREIPKGVSEHKRSTQENAWMWIILVGVFIFIGGCFTFIAVNFSNADKKALSVVEGTEESATKPNTETGDATVIPDSQKPDVAVSALIDPMQSGLIIYSIGEDNEGNYHDSALAGQEATVANIWELNLRNVENIPRYFKGVASLNQEYLWEATFNTRIEIYVDRELQYKFHPQKADALPEYFCIDLSGADKLEICIYGANELRIFDAIFSDNAEEFNTAHKELGQYVSALDNLSMISNDSGLCDYLTARDNTGETYYRALGGYNVEGASSNTYMLEGKYTRMRGRTILNYVSRNVDTVHSCVKIYVDNELCYCSPDIVAGMEPDDFEIDLTDAQYLKIEVEGRYYARLVNLELE